MNERPYKRKEVIGDCTLYLGDCCDILPTLGGVDVVITSPPYNLGNTSGGGFPAAKMGHYRHDAKMTARGGQGKWSKASAAGGLGNGYASYSDALPHHEYVAWQHKLLRQCFDLLADDGAIFYNHKPRVLNGLLVTPFEYNPGLPVRQVVVWARAGGINFSPAFYVPTHEWVMVIAKPGFRLRDKAASGLGDVWYIPQESNTLHPAPFPLKLPANILETTKGRVVLDPFAGSGTTALACVKTGRSFIGIEIDEGYFNIACDRVRKAYAQPDLFIERPTPAKQEAWEL
jgi:site-specific DNA-methyltransferase (adenine-specific)